MTIKKGISQMAEYPNVEINYVVSKDGNMYYVLKNGELSNGSIIATLDPKRAIDENVVCDSIGVFNADGDILIDFNKKEIRKINDDFLLVVNALPKSELVVNALKNENDEISKTMMKDNSATIVDKMMIEMGITGEILFSDAYSEANVYKTDSVNHKVGPDCSFIGKNDTNFYFHTNDSTQETIVIGLNGEAREQVEKGFEMPDIPINEIIDSSMKINPEETFYNDISVENVNSTDLQLDINQNILDGFKPIESEINVKNEIGLSETQEVDNGNEKTDLTIDLATTESTDETSDVNTNDEVLDNAIEVVKKMIEETSNLKEKILELEEKNNKLNEKISNLEEELDSKNKIIISQQSKKHELNDLLEEANEVLENID